MLQDYYIVSIIFRNNLMKYLNYNLLKRKTISPTEDHSLSEWSVILKYTTPKSLAHPRDHVGIPTSVPWMTNIHEVAVREISTRKKKKKLLHQREYFSLERHKFKQHIMAKKKLIFIELICLIIERRRGSVGHWLFYSRECLMKT